LWAAKQEGFDIRLICQPPNSSDFNILDLGFFQAIQAIQYKKDAKIINDLVPAVQQVMINCFIQQDNALVSLFLEQLIYSLIEFLNTCFVGILRVLSMESK